MKKNLQFILLSIFVLFPLLNVSAQVNYFSKTYGLNAYNEWASKILELPKGEYLILGTSVDKNNTNNYKWDLIKTKTNGELIFQKTIKTPADYSPNFELSVNSEGNYVVEAQKGFKWLKIITDTNGKVITETIYNLPLDTFLLNTRYLFLNVNKREGNGYFIFGANEQMNFLIHLDHNLKTLWAINLFQDDTLRRWPVEAIYRNNKYFIAATVNGDSANLSRGFILQSLDNKGDIIVKNHFPGRVYGIRKIVPISDGNYLIGGNTFQDHRPANRDVLITKFTPGLDTVWSKLIYNESDTSEATMRDDQLGDMEATSDGGAIIYSFISNGNDSTIWRRSLIKIDSEGNKLWERNLYGMDSVPVSPYFNIYSDLVVTSDGGFGLIGSKMVNSSSDCYFLKTNAYGLMSGVDEDKIVNKESFITYPNPSSGDVTIQFSERVGVSKEITLYDITGREVRNFKNIRENKFIIQSEGLQKGLYLLQVIDKAGNLQQGKIIFE